MSDVEDVISDNEDGDDLVGKGSPEHSQRDEEEDYEAPVQDEEQSMDGGEETGHTQEEEEEEEEEDEETKAYVLSNRVAYYVPKSDGTKPGRVRDHNLPMEVEDGQELTSLQHAKNWPSVENIHPMSIVVVKGRFIENEPVNNHKEVGPFAWYVRVSIKGRKDGPDRKLLRLMPKSVVIDFLQHIGGLSEMWRSSLICTFQPENDNAKSFPVHLNGWEANKEIKTEAIPLPRAPKKTADPEASADADDATDKKKKPVKYFNPILAKKNGQNKPMPPAAEAKKPMPTGAEAKKPMPPAAEAKKPEPPIVEAKKPKPDTDKKEKSAVSSVPQPKKNTMLAFTKPNKPTHVNTDESIPFDRPSGSLKTNAPPEPTSEQRPLASSSSQKRSSDNSDVKEALEYKFKRIRKLEVETESKTLTFWDGNTIYVAERY